MIITNEFGECTIYDGGMKKKVIIKFDDTIDSEVQNLIYLFINSACELGATFGYIISTIPIAYSTYSLRILIEYMQESIALSFLQKK